MPNPRRARGSLFPVLAVVAALTLSGCASAVEPVAAETPAAQPAVEPSPTPTPTEPADPLESATELVVRPEQLDVLDASGAIVAELSYDLPTDEFVGALTTVFGSAPDHEVLVATHRSPQIDAFLWDGFEVYDDLVGYRDGNEWVTTDEPDLSDMNVHVVAGRPAVGDVGIRTVEGYRPGDDLEWVDSIEGSASTRLPEVPWLVVAVETGPELGERWYDEVPNANSVVFVSYLETTLFDGSPWEPTQILAPRNIGVPSV
ncbi:hypothetical protein ARHIZOSPH14_01800 [Agromyces rhizosphaerae]|uniref:Uncharacterized protein n=1 Tax=Agromyces rhizosphaerae TaxID=88374 RepID=A0A9W6FQC8_9MICO|nr:hypothetical protein [Agromyces rhizosphaerae]GLI25938.1 hypothetical protein ARHIZOSPH14_01800 [Agromyces rhizosphaerae]